MRISQAGSLATAMAVMLTVGCAGGDTEAPSEPDPSESFDCQTAESQEEWEEHGCDESVGGDEQAGGAPVPLGEAFDYEPMDAEGEPAGTWTVALSEVECGLTSLPETDPNPEWDGGDDKPEYLDAEPEEGNDFCVLQWDWENVGKKPVQVDGSGDMMLGDEQHARSEEDQFDRSWRLMDARLDFDHATEINPGQTAKTLDVYQVPEGVVMDAVWFPMETMVSPPWILVATK